MSEDERRDCLRGIRDWVGSVKTSLGIGRSPCSNGSRLGWRRDRGLGLGSLAEFDEDVDVSMGSLMAQTKKENL